MEKAAERKLSWWEEAKLHYGGFAMVLFLAVVSVLFGRLIYKVSRK